MMGMKLDDFPFWQRVIARIMITAITFVALVSTATMAMLLYRFGRTLFNYAWGLQP